MNFSNVNVSYEFSVKIKHIKRKKKYYNTEIFHTFEIFQY